MILRNDDGTLKRYDEGGGSTKTIKASYDEDTALYAHAVGDFIYLNEHFYKVTVAIAVGDTIEDELNVTDDTGLSVDTPIYVNNLPGEYPTPETKYKIMTAVIDLNDNNSETCVRYADDAYFLTKGSAKWDEFIGHYPVLLDSNGNVLGRLDKNNYKKYEDGTDAPVNVLGSYDVMVYFPKRGLNIRTIGDYLYVSATDDPNNTNFKYYAHSYGAQNNCNGVYVGAYLGTESDGKLYSCSGQTPTTNQTMGTFRGYSNARGNTYEQMTFYVRTYLCAMYILKFGNLNSQEAVGCGYVDGNSSATATGNTDAKGMDWGETTGKYQSKCLGIEDLWGNLNEWFDGIFSDTNRNILTSIYNKNMNDTGSGYRNNGQGATADIGNYMSKPQGTTETGFIAKEANGSATTYFCDYAALYALKVVCGSGSYGDADNAGVFLLGVVSSASDAGATIGSRLVKFDLAS